MRRVYWFVICIFVATLGGHVSAAELTGAGSTFVYPIVSKWATAYKKETGIKMNYQSIGSGGGIAQILAKTVDFGATDMPLKPDELKRDGLVQFPIINGAVVPVVHVTGIKPGELKLSGPVLAAIYLGKIKKWNDPAIIQLNKKIHLPDKDITIIHRSDGSGTSFIFTNYLSKVSPEWKTKVGASTAVNWPTGVGGKGNEGLAAYVKQMEGSIGYVEFAYAATNNMAFVQMKNRSGSFVKPTASTFASAVRGANWVKAKDFYMILTDAPGKQSWPIAGTTFALMQKITTNPNQVMEVLKFFSWAYRHGKAAKELLYVPLTHGVVTLVNKTFKEIRTADGKKVVSTSLN